MSLIAEGLMSTFVIFIVCLIAVAYFMWMTKSGKKYAVRVLPAIEAINDGVDRAVETGRPIFVTTGVKSDIRSGDYAPMVLGGMSIMKYTAIMAAERGADIKFLVPPTEGLVPVYDAIYKESAVEAGKLDAYKPENVIYLGPDVYLWAVVAQDIINKQGAALFIDAGAWTSDADIAGHFAAMDNGGISIGGTLRYHHQGSIYISSDYPLIMDEIYGAAAHCSGDELTISTVMASDIVKILTIVISIIGIILITAGLPFVNWFNL